ncbi:MAG: cation-translocating P-type ATPase [Oscillospiraceae bacterium]|nr:cation-translocating P-type ATPase [Oscillospiraceae bacterium]
MQRHRSSLQDIFKELQTDSGKGLTSGQIPDIQKEKGLNKFDDEKKETVLQKALHHLVDITSLILLAAAVIAFIVAIFDPSHGFTDSIVIMSIVVINVVLATKQEMGAEKALDALKNMHANMTVVLRDGEKQNINAVDLVPGDILILGAGDMIPADARIIESSNLKVDESILTGESVPVEKDGNLEIAEDAPLGDRFNMLFSGCLITNGRVKAVVVETGMSTEMGKIAGLLSDTKKVKTPLQKKMDGLGRILCMVAIAAGAGMFLMEIINGNFAENPLLVLLNAVSMAVAVVPECLPIIVTASLAYGVMLMANKHAIIRRLSAVETLGSASVICSDKTGTLTMNRMTIQKVWIPGHDPIDAQSDFNHNERFLIEIMSLASNASIEVNAEGESVKEIGDPTETAIVRLLRDKNITKKSLDAIFYKMHELPFDSQRKLMTTVHELPETEKPKEGQHRYISITKGAFDRIPIDPATVCGDTAKRIHDEFAQSALRVIAAGYKYYEELPAVLDEAELEKDLIFAGFVGMIDPPRPESAIAVQTAKEAGIKTVMITGDHVITASAIAKEIGIFSEGDKTMTGVELAKMSDDELAENVKSYSVYARVSPEDKIRIVKAWQSHGEVVAMTGDGVNDAPALKAANAGVAMGSGTDVSKSASDVVLTDDNFASIVDAVKEGRRVYTNIRKVLCSLISCNLSEIFTMLLGILFWQRAPIVAIQLLFINVVADGVPDLCMCREPAEKDVMRQKPVEKNESIFARGVATRIIIYGTVFAVVSLIAYYLGAFVDVYDGYAPSHEIGMTMAYLVIGGSSVVNILNVRSFSESVFSKNFFGNKMLLAGICFSFAALGLTATVPGLRDVFYCVPMGSNHWLIAIGLSLAPLFAGEIHKIFVRRKMKKLTVGN